MAMSAHRPETGAADMHALLTRFGEEGVQVDARHYGRVMHAWRLSGDFQRVSALFEELLSRGMTPGPHHFGELIGALAEGGQFDEANAVFEQACAEGKADRTVISSSA
jgi:hypothetical protein